MYEEGKITYNGVIFRYSLKVYDEPSIFGLNNGRISKMTIREIFPADREVVNYDRGWDVRPLTHEARGVYKILLERFN